MADDKLTETQLDALFDAAQRSRIEPEADWLAGVTEDAERETRLRAQRTPAPLWRQVIGSLGGWQGLGGMAVACATGLWIGIAPPQALGDPVAQVFAADTSVDWLSDATFDAVAFLEEG